MNVCIVTSALFPPTEGIGNYIYNMSKELIRKGNEVTIITRGEFRRTYNENLDGIALFRVPYVPIYPIHVYVHGIFVERFIKSIEDNFDIMHFHTPLPPAVKTHLPTITTVHTPMKTDTKSVELVNPSSVAIKMQGKISYLIEKKLFAISDKITSVASSVSDELSQYGLNPEDIEVIGNGVNEKFFMPAVCSYDKNYILFVGRLSYRKGLFDLLECGKKICARYPNINFKIVGMGPLYKTLKKIAKESGYENRFEFLGYVEKKELLWLYQNAILFVLPSHYEGLPTTLLEAMACGLPIIATGVSGNLDVIENGVNGILIPAKSPDIMAKEISRQLDDENMRVRLGYSARNTIEQEFTWNIVSNKILHCYRSILND